jgi:protein NUD1
MIVPLRMNPCTLGWYLPLLVRDVPGALQPSEEGTGTGKTKTNLDMPGGGDNEKGRDRGKYSAWRWQELDSKFRRDLPDEAYVGRLAYRGLIMRACREIRMLDGVEVSDKERDKASRLLTGILGKSRADVSEIKQAPRI